MIAEDRHELGVLRKRLERLPKEKIIIRHRSNCQECYLISKEACTGKRVETYVPKKNLRKLVECYSKEYCLALEPLLVQEIELLEYFMSAFDPDRKYEPLDIIPAQLTGHFQPVTVPQKQKCREWAAEEYKRNPYPMDEANMYLTEKGDVVRSRAECLAANILLNLDLDYRCECILRLDGKRTVYPDFTIMHPVTGELWYIEIFGMMGNADYAMDAFHKINDYAKSSCSDRAVFFFDYPGVPFDPNAFKALVSKIFIP